MTGGRSASILTRLLNLAKQRGDDYSLLLNRFGLERLLHRVSVSRHSERFLLKGALLFSLWYDRPHRPTRDADLLGFGSDGLEDLTETFREIAAIDLGDGIEFDLPSIRAELIREANLYGGTRVRIVGHIGKTRAALQVDVGFGDAVTPAPERVQFPTLLEDFDALDLRVYPVYTVIAEKYQAMVALGMANTRMKDFYDLAVIAKRTELDGLTLAQAMAATFNRRGTPLPEVPPLALTAAFADIAAKQQQWVAFLRKNRLASDTLAETVCSLHAFLWPPSREASAPTGKAAIWLPDRLAWFT